MNGRIELRKVGLDYDTGRGPVFTDIDLTVNPGERIALLGDNGAGKSTLLSLIGGLYRPTTGQVLLDGHSVPDTPEHWLHQQIAMVLQDTFLFSGTLADNIRYGRPTHPTPRSPPPPTRRWSASSPTSSPTGSTPPSAPAGSACPAGSANASASPAHCSSTPPSCSSTNPPPAWTPTPRNSSSKH